MTVSVELPRMGENVTEGTIVRWLKQEGEWVDADEPLVEISTDKIDTELPAPAAGMISKIVAKEDETVAVGTEIAVIDESAAKEGEAAAADDGDGAEEPKKEQPKEEAQPAAEAKAEASKGEPSEDEPSEPEPAVAANGDDGRKEPIGALSPLVRKLARENGVDLGEVKGSGRGGRITKQDVLAYLDQRGAKPSKTGEIKTRTATPSRPAAESTSSYAVPSGATEEVPFTRIRKAIAEHMRRSLDTSAHVTNVFEVDMTRIAALRERAKGEFKKQEGFSLTFLPFVASAVVQAVQAFPEFNAHVDGEAATATLFRAVNLGIAVARDEG
ncbi:MAG: dihydrolipoamide acetyltransferase family protein, partial [Actinomycetota bacterium]